MKVPQFDKSSSLVNRLKKSNIASAFFKVSLWNGLSKLLIVLSLFYCTHQLSKEDFGQFSFVRNTLDLIIVLCASNYASLCTKFTVETCSSDKAVKRLFLLFIFTFSICVCLGGLFFFIPDHIKLNYLGSIFVLHSLKLSAVLLPFFMAQPLIEGVLTGLKLFHLRGIISTLSSLLLLLLLILLIHLYGLRGSVYALLLYFLLYSLSLIVVFYLVNQKYHVIRAVSNLYEEINVISKIILPVFVMSFVTIPLNWVAQSMIVKFDSYASIGSLTVILQICNLTMLVPTYYFNSMLPYASEYNNVGNTNAYYHLFNKSLFFMLGASVSFVIVLLLFGHFLLGLFGAEYIKDYPFFVLGVCVLPIRFVAELFKLNMVIREYQRQMMLMSLFSSTLFFLVMYYLLLSGVHSVFSYMYAFMGQYIVEFFVSYLIYKFKRV